MITSFCENYKNSISGKYSAKHSKEFKSSSEISGGAKIKLFFNELFADYLKNDHRATSEYPYLNILIRISRRQY